MNTLDLLKSGKKPLIAAHRGLALGNIPCNTPVSYAFALKNGADIIELDVSVTKDKQLLVFHPGMEYAHTNSKLSFTEMTAEEIDRDVRLLNVDNAVTQFKISRFKDILLLLKGKCVVNVDKFWTEPELISGVIRECGMEQDVIIKTGPNKHDLDNVRKYAPDMPYMPVVEKAEDFEALFGDSSINLIGAEVCFNTEDSPFAKDEYIKKIHSMGLYLWVNSIVYNYKANLNAGHSDDTAAAGDPEKGWGWLYDKGYDIIQTDYTGFIQDYFDKYKR